MKTLGIYPSDSEIDMLIGDECAVSSNGWVRM